MKYTYLASCYSSPYPAIMQERFDRVVRAAGILMREGETVFSPIAHSHPIGLYIGKEVDHEFWMRQDLPMLAHSSELKVLTIPGWDTSIGVNEEIQLAQRLGIPVHFVDEKYIGALQSRQHGKSIK